MWRVRVRLTLMLAAAANATATPAPARHLWFTNGFSRRAFRYPAHAAGVAGYRMVSVLSSRPVMSRFRRGVRRGKVSVTNVCDANQTRQLAPAIAGRWLGKKMAHTARISSLRSSRGRTLAITRGRLLISAFRISGSAFSPGLHRAGTCAAFAAEAGSLRTKHRHGSARARG